MPEFDISRVQEQRQEVWHGMRGILETAHGEGRSTLSEAEETEYSNREGELSRLDDQITRLTRFNERESARDDVAETRGVSRDELDSAEHRYASAYDAWFTRGASRLSAEQRDVLDANSLSTAPGAPAAGPTGFTAGYLIPQDYWANLQIALKAYGGLLNRARVLNTDSGAPMPWPSVDPTNVVGYYLTEQSQLGFGGGQESGGTAMLDYAFGQGMLSAWTIASGVILASQQLLEDSAFDVDSFVSDRIGEAIGRKVAQELHTGTGNQALLGIQTALAAKAASGIGQGGVYASPGGSVPVLGASAPTGKLASGLVGYDDILTMITYVDPAYRASGNCSWIVSDQTLAGLRRVTDNYGHPIWEPNIQTGAVGQIYGYDVVVDQNAGSISTTAGTPGGLLFGDFSTAMVVRQVNGAHTMRLNERYADFLQTGFLGFVRMDCRSNDLRAAVMYKSPAS